MYFLASRNDTEACSRQVLDGVDGSSPSMEELQQH
jgi:hypothetical protein